MINLLVKKSPTLIQPLVQKIANPLQTFLQANLEYLFGTRSNWTESSGKIPYPSCLVDTTSRRYVDFLKQIATFLDNHPNEVFTLFVEDWIRNNDVLAKEFEESGLLKYAYAKPANTPWPTLGELITSGKRLIVFSSTSAPAYSWLNFTPVHFSSYNDTLKPEELKKLAQKKALPALPTMTHQVDPQLFIALAHFTTPGIAGSKQDATKKDVLRYNAQRIATLTNHIPNFISVDFYRVPNKDVFDVQNELNGVGNYKGKPLWTAKK